MNILSIFSLLIRKTSGRPVGDRPVINCDSRPSIPAGWQICEHIKGGRWQWNPEVTLYTTGEQGEMGEWGHDLRKRLIDKPVMNACVLDYLLAHQEIIPESWKTKKVVFWGTIYQIIGNQNGVRCLAYSAQKGWSEDVMWLRDVFGDEHRAALYCHLRPVTVHLNPILAELS